MLGHAGIANAAVTHTTADAHAIRFAERGTQLALIYRVGADDLDAVKRLQLVLDPSGYDTQWKKFPISLRVSGSIVVVDSEAPVIATTTWIAYGTWTKGPDGHYLF